MSRKSIVYLMFFIFLFACRSKNTSIVLEDSALEVFTTADGIEYVRTPETFFKNLPDWHFDAKYLEIDGLRQAYIDEGPRTGQAILLLHGQPAWSYLYRHMIPVLVGKGYRVIAMDHLGMGRSDKPIDPEYHSFDNHLKRLEIFIRELNLDKLTVFLQDWGSVIGLYLATSDTTTFDRIILGNGGLPVVDQRYALPENLEKSINQFHRMFSMIPDQQQAFFDEEGHSLLPVNDGSEEAGGFGQWMAYAWYHPEFQVSRMIEGLTYRALSTAEEAAYDAPFPARIAMAGPRSFPSLLNDLVNRTRDKKDVLRRFDKPFLTVFGQNDPGLAGDDTQQWILNNVPGAVDQKHQLYPDASHFLQDDKGKEIALLVADFIEANPL